MKITKKEKPTTHDMTDGFGFKQTRLSEVGVGCLKPQRGRGGIDVPSKLYLGEDELNVKMKKGEGIGEKIKKEHSKDSTPSWTDVI